MKRFSKAIVLTMMMTAGVTGCTPIGPADPKDGYSTEFAMSAVEYNIYLNKQVGVAENLIFTRMAAAKSMTAGGHEREKQCAEEASLKLHELINDVTVTRPAVGYDTDRDSVLTLLKDALSAMESYSDALASGKTLSSFVEEFNSIYISLGGEANSYYN